MDKKDFKKGQTVYIVADADISRGRNFSDYTPKAMFPATVQSVGTKWLKIDVSGYYKLLDFIRLEHEHGFYEDSSGMYYTHAELYLTEEEAQLNLDRWNTFQSLKKGESLRNLIFRMGSEDLHTVMKVLDKYKH